jgi:hypothetical protein
MLSYSHGVLMVFSWCFHGVLQPPTAFAGKSIADGAERAFTKVLGTVASEQSLVKLNLLSPSPKSRQD